MSAILKAPEIRGEQYIHERLERWANWARCAAPGDVSSSEGYLREALDQAHPGEPTEEIAITDKAVARMKVSRSDYWRFFSRFYLNPSQLSYDEIARQTGQNEERVKTALRQARFLVGYQIHLIENLTTSA